MVSISHILLDKMRAETHSNKSLSAYQTNTLLHGHTSCTDCKGDTTTICSNHKSGTSRDLLECRGNTTLASSTYKFRASKDLTECRGELGSLRSTSMSVLELINLLWSSFRSSDTSSFWTSASSIQQTRQ